MWPTDYQAHTEYRLAINTINPTPSATKSSGHNAKYLGSYDQRLIDPARFLAVQLRHLQMSNRDDLIHSSDTGVRIIPESSYNCVGGLPGTWGKITCLEMCKLFGI